MVFYSWLPSTQKKKKTQRNKKVITQEGFSTQTLHKRLWKECKGLTAGWEKYWGLISQILLIYIKKSGNLKKFKKVSIQTLNK